MESFAGQVAISLRNLRLSQKVAIELAERKQAQAALTRSEQAYRSLFENMPIGLYRTSLDGRILDANPALVRMFGYPDRDSLLAVKAVDLYMDPACEERFQREIQKQGVLSGFEAEFRRYGQSSFWAEDYVRLVYDEAGNP
jgi:PAS domain S-box-containing protein